jgi:hypothetical protein
MMDPRTPILIYLSAVAFQLAIAWYSKGFITSIAVIAVANKSI